MNIRQARKYCKSKKWFRLILVLFIIYRNKPCIITCIGPVALFNPTWDYMISGATMVFIYSIAIYAYFNDKVFKMDLI